MSIKITNPAGELNINSIINLLSNDDYLIRCDILEELSQFIDDDRILDTVLGMINDKNYLVRCEACDTLYNTKSSKALDRLMNRLKYERSSTARMYIVSTICHIIKSVKFTNEHSEVLYTLYEKEKSPRVIIAYLTVLYLLSKDQKYIEKALEYLNDDDYHVRCNVINLVDEIRDESIEDMVNQEYKKRYLIEATQSVRSLLTNSINSN